MGSVQKICCACNADVANQRRVKDPQGNYFCQPCYDAKLQEKLAITGSQTTTGTAAKRTPAAATAAAVADPYDFPPAETGDISLADDVKPAPASSPDMFGCADCKKLVPSKQIRNDDGDFVCHICFSKRRAGRTAKPAAKSKSFAEEEGVSSEPGFKDSFLGGVIISGAIILLAFGIFLALNMSGGENNSAMLALNIVASGLEALFVALAAGSLIASMVILARILGGCDFGTFGGALWKSTAIMLGFFLVNVYLNRLAGMMLYGLGLRGILLILTFIVVFRLEYFEAALLTVINFFILLFLAFAMVVLLASIGRMMSRESYDEDNSPAFEHRQPGADLQPIPPAGQPAPAPAQPAAPAAGQ